MDAVQQQRVQTPHDHRHDDDDDGDQQRRLQAFLAARPDHLAQLGACADEVVQRGLAQHRAVDQRDRRAGAGGQQQQPQRQHPRFGEVVEREDRPEQQHGGGGEKRRIGSRTGLFGLRFHQSLKDLPG